MKQINLIMFDLKVLTVRLIINIWFLICIHRHFSHLAFALWPFSVLTFHHLHLMCVPLLQFGSENQQLEWARRESEQEEQERLRRLQLQEQQDLELAIALSRADMSDSWPGSLFLHPSPPHLLHVPDSSTGAGPTWLTASVTNVCERPVIPGCDWTYVKWLHIQQPVKVHSSPNCTATV